MGDSKEAKFVVGFMGSTCLLAFVVLFFSSYRVFVQFALAQESIR